MRHGRGVLLGVLVLVSSVTAFAQVRDASTPSAGTAIIEGVVVTDDATPKPLRRAIVTVSGDAVPDGRSAVTDDSGRFAIAGLPPGRVTIAAVKPGYVGGAYGARRPGRPGTPVVVAEGERFAATIQMAPAGVITGIVRDAYGQPLSGLRVFATNARDPEVARRSPTEGGPGTGVETDDRGIYRIYGLEPGDYLVLGAPTASANGDIARPSAGEIDRILAGLEDRRRGGGVRNLSTGGSTAPTTAATLAAIFYPGTATMADATPVTIGRGEVRDGVDFVVRAVPVTTIQGEVVHPGGPLPASIELSIIPESTLRLFALASANPQLSQAPGTDGRFTYTTITPGHYRIVARARESSASGLRGRGGAAGAGRVGGPVPPDTLYAVADLDVATQPVAGVRLTLGPGARFAGRVIYDAAGDVPDAVANISISVRPLAGGSSSSVGGTRIGTTFATPQTVQVDPDGTFVVAGLAPGTYEVSARAPATAAGEAWWLRSALVNGHDVLDTFLDVTLGSDVADAVLTLTDRHSELAGTLETATGLPAPEYVIVVMPADRSLWRADSRRLRTTRPDTAGRFSFADLPAGEYVLAALTDLDPEMWQSPAFLAEIAAGGVSVALGEGERLHQVLRINRDPSRARASWLAPGSQRRN